MVTDRYYEEQFECPECNTIQKHYQWATEMEKVEHKCVNADCEHKITHLDIAEKAQSQITIINGKMTKDEIMVDRKNRSKNHFQKEIMPYLPKKDQSAMIKRGYKNK